MQEVNFLGWQQFGNRFRVVEKRPCAPKTFA